MMQFFRQLGDWFDAHPSLLWLLTGFSVFAFFATLIAVPILVAWIPADYFAHPARQRILFAGRSPLVRSGLLMGKNLLGVILLIMGIAMLVLPGQGLLTILVGLLLIDFPGKYHWQKWLASRPPVLRAINWLRKRRGAPPIQL